MMRTNGWLAVLSPRVGTLYWLRGVTFVAVAVGWGSAMTLSVLDLSVLAQSPPQDDRVLDVVPLEDEIPIAPQSGSIPGVRPRPLQAKPLGLPRPGIGMPRPLTPRPLTPRLVPPQPVTPQPASLPSKPAGLGQAYTLGPNDRLLIKVFNIPEFSGEQQILADGSLNLPLIGRVVVSGMTLQEAGKSIARSYRAEVVNPDVTVILLKPRPLRVAIAGEVSRPGLYTLGGNDAQFPSVAQAIQSAGGLTQAADLRQVKLKRTLGNGTQQLMVLDLWELLGTGDVTQDWPLRDGDAIVIPETAIVNIAETNRLSFSNLSASNLAASTGESMIVGVIGEVFRPGAYELGGNRTNIPAAGGRVTVTKAIQTAGGIKPSANIRQVQVRRVTRNGAEQLINLDFWQLKHSADLSQDLLLQQGDTVIIPIADALTPSEVAQITASNLSPNVIRINVVGEVTKPGPVEVAANTTLNQAVLAAGGFTQRASESVELIRLNPNGTVLSQKVRVNVRQGLNAERNPILLNNDVIIVGTSRGAKVLDQLDTVFGPILRIFAPLRGLLR